MLGGWGYPFDVARHLGQTWLGNRVITAHRGDPCKDHKDPGGAIRDRDRRFGFDFCCAFRDWVDHASQAGRVSSIDEVAVELDAVDDDFKTRASEPPDAFSFGADAASAPLDAMAGLLTVCGLLDCVAIAQRMGAPRRAGQESACPSIATAARAASTRVNGAPRPIRTVRPRRA